MKSIPVAGRQGFILSELMNRISGFAGFTGNNY
jgi:hypothetical protein